MHSSAHRQRLGRASGQQAGAAGARPLLPVCRAQPQAATEQVKVAPWPTSYENAMRQAQEAAKLAIADGYQLLEVEIPTTSLSAVSGDGEGQNEMNASMEYLFQFLGGFKSKAAKTRVFFPDQVEAKVAKYGQTMDPAAGRKALEPQAEASNFGMGYLTKQNAVWAMTGMNLGGTKFTPSSQVKDTDELLVVAYPSFNPREELSATNQLWLEKAKPRGMPIIIFNGELDRVRGGYYPGLFFPELAKLTREFVPLIEPVYYIHNFKGTRPAALYRCYPGPWQVLRRNPLDSSDMRLVWQGDRQPTLKEVAVDILPNAHKELTL